MKIRVESYSTTTEPLASAFDLPEGLIGLESFTRAELAASPDESPFIRLHLHGPEGAISFVVIEPAGVVRDYEPELFAADAAALGIRETADVVILNIVKLAGSSPVSATVNLVGPIVVNRRTQIGRQLVIANYADYDADHALVAAAEQTATVG